ncbi:tetratricopeptide (TPR) repeat protein [Streptomyces canus]|uniref:tetratricopeptide repeat protein n=1 Tax=Streptomyces canus TaxID=58343 RepID=UPI00278553C0|nr:tetratricopeptide repeat protein [Streptomyces canus]MDQ0605416.1 tetratricopeptide (TPR) repeat protein [Streptomyces canus]
MTGTSGEAVGQPAPPAGLHGSSGAIVAGGDVTASSTQVIEAGQAFVLPPEAYAPIPDDAAAGGVSNIGTDLFVGRIDELATLETAFARPGEVVVHAVHGLGGVGKSALAARWAARRPEKVRWWVTADTPAAVDAGMAALARALQPGLTGLPAELQGERAVAWLAGHAGWLLVLDNVEDPVHIRPLLDRLPGGRVLVTTRRATGWHRDATAIRLGVFDPAEAVDLFTRIFSHHGPRNTDGADAVCAELGYLALAVEQAAAYCAETGTSPREYLDMLAQWPATMFAAGTAGGDSERTIARIWHLTLNRLADTPLAGSLLRILAWYAPDNIPRDLLQGLAEPPQLATAIGRLAAYSMITDNHDGTLTIHRLLQALARTPDAGDTHRTPEAVDHARDQAAALLAEAFSTDVHQPETWPRCRALLPHTDALTRHHTPDHDTTHTAHALDRAAAYQSGQGSLTPAIHAFQRALATRDRVLGGDHPHTLTSRNNLAHAYQAAGDLGRAIPLFERTLATRERVLGGDHRHTLTSRNNLAHAYQEAGDLSRAIPLHEHTLTERERVLGEDDPQTLTSRNNLAYAYQEAGDLGRAIPLYEGTLTERERVLGGDHPDALASRNNLAYAYRAAGDLGLAIRLYERTLTDCERVLGADHPHTLTSRNNLASAYKEAGDLGRAIPMHERALEEYERVLGGDHPDTLTSRNNLAHSYQEAGDLGRAIALYERTLEDYERVLGGDHPSTLLSRNNLAGAYRAAGDLGRAIRLYERTLTERERVLGGDHPDALASRNNLAGAYQEAGDLGRAIRLYERNVEDYKRVLGGDHPDTLTSQSNLAYAYREAGDPGRAIPLYERTLTERVLGGDHPNTLLSRNNLAGAYQEAGDLGRAISLHERNVEDYERVLGGDHPSTLLSRNNLAGAYQEAGHLGRAIPLYERTLADCERALSPEHPAIAVVRANLERARSM